MKQGRRKKQRERRLQSFQSLSACLSKLTQHVRDEDELAAILAYSVVEGLRSFDGIGRQYQHGPQERERAVKAIYSSLDRAAEDCLNSSGYSVLCKLQGSVDPFIETALESDEHHAIPDHGSQLLTAIVGSLINKKNYRNRLVDFGRIVLERVRRAPGYKTPRTTYDSDYEMILSSPR
ncbi:MAG: hypothetical protein V1659_05310 [Candidatus Woesearchaeota archaeon]